MISSLAWVKKGAAKEQPERVELSEEEYQRIQQEMGVQLEDAQMEYEEELGAQEKTDSTEPKKKQEEGDELDIYNLDNYDEEEPEKQKGIYIRLTSQSVSFFKR